MQETAEPNASETEKAERAGVIEQMLAARTLQELEQADAVRSAWLTRHPSDWAILRAGAPFADARDWAELRDTERRLLGFDAEKGRVREAIFVQAERANTLDEIVQARQDLLRWKWQYPCDAATVEALLDFLCDREQIQILVQDVIGLDDSEQVKAAAVVSHGNGKAHTNGNGSLTATKPDSVTSFI